MRLILTFTVLQRRTKIIIITCNDKFGKNIFSGMKNKRRITIRFSQNTIRNMRGKTFLNFGTGK